MRRQTLIILGLLSLGILFLGIALFNVDTLRSLLSSNKFDPSTDVSGTLESPVNPKNPYLYSVGISYIFQGTILAVKKTNGGPRVYTDIQGVGVPEFIINRLTQVYMTDGDKSKEISQKEVAAHQAVRIQVTYNTTKKEWATTRIVILVKKLPQ
ncbi:MAG: hypothetical protein HYT10_01905 [Candidatus Levybacteria bacterium]|nr:hypothetical protein [Candidatus Levybacteria bacterium]